MLYRVMFYACLSGWMYGMGELSSRGAELIWFAVFSIVLGYLSHVTYTHGYRLEDLSTDQVEMLRKSFQTVLLLYFAGLSVTVHKMPADIRGMLVGIGFYFGVFYLLGLNLERDGVPTR